MAKSIARRLPDPCPSTMRTREYIEKSEREGKTLLDAMRDGATEGMQHFDGELEKLVRDGAIELETGLAYATNPGNPGKRDAGTEGEIHRRDRARN